MNNYLFTWNPKKSPWEDLPTTANRSAAGKVIFATWSCHANHKNIKKGDRVFLVRLGQEPKGIIGSGWTTSGPYSGRHFDEERAARGEKTFYVDCEWERLLNPLIDEPLSLPRLQTGKLAAMRWTPQSSGVLIPAEVADGLERIWAKHIGASSLGGVDADQEISAFEGDARMAFVRHRKREQKLRGAKLKQAREKLRGRLICEVPRCGFDFEAVYGELGRDYAQVHHLKPLGDRTTPSETKLTDLAIVCANCHAMIHRGGKCRTLDDLIKKR